VRLIRADDRWLFLTPEVEREVPVLLEAIGQGDAAAEQERIDRLIAAGTIERWFAYLRDCRRRLELAAPDADPATVARLAAVLREQYLLVPALRPDEPDDEPEQRRLKELAWTSH
jgi:hypothetical protein